VQIKISPFHWSLNLLASTHHPFPIWATIHTPFLQQEAAFLTSFEQEVVFLTSSSNNVHFFSFSATFVYLIPHFISSFISFPTHLPASSDLHFVWRLVELEQINLRVRGVWVNPPSCRFQIFKGELRDKVKTPLWFVD